MAQNPGDFAAPCEREPGSDRTGRRAAITTLGKGRAGLARAAHPAPDTLELPYVLATRKSLDGCGHGGAGDDPPAAHALSGDDRDMPVERAFIAVTGEAGTRRRARDDAMAMGFLAIDGSLFGALAPDAKE